MPDRPDHILTTRLAEYIDPWEILGIKRTRIRGPERAIFAHESARTAIYDHARIRYFARIFAMGQHVDPLEVDCRCEFGRVYAWPLLLDGHHRLAGAILAKVERIRIDFGGRVDLLRYLQGRRKTPPAY